MDWMAKKTQATVWFVVFRSCDRRELFHRLESLPEKFTKDAWVKMTPLDMRFITTEVQVSSVGELASVLSATDDLQCNAGRSVTAVTKYDHTTHYVNLGDKHLLHGEECETESGATIVAETHTARVRILQEKFQMIEVALNLLRGEFAEQLGINKGEV